jgi:hypothetical protein
VILASREVVVTEERRRKVTLSERQCVCGQVIKLATKRGLGQQRNARYCSNACRQRAYRVRKHYVNR